MTGFPHLPIGSGGSQATATTTRSDAAAKARSRRVRCAALLTSCCAPAAAAAAATPASVVAPAAPWMPARPAILRPAEHALLRPGAFRPCTPAEGRALLADLVRCGRLTRDEARHAVVFIPWVAGGASWNYGDQISAADGSIITDITSGTPAGTFDDNTSQPYAAVANSGVNTSTNHYIGKDFASVRRSVSKVQTWPPTNLNGYSWTGTSITLYLYGKSDGVPSDYQDGTILGTLGPFTDTTSGPQQIASSDETTLWRCLWVRIYCGGNTSTVGFAEVRFFYGY